MRHYTPGNPIDPLLNKEFVREFWHQSRDPTSHEQDTFVSARAGVGRPDFISWFKHKVMLNLGRTFNHPS